MTLTRAEAKAERRAALLDAAARLFAERGFERVTLEDIGGAAGISGPAVYRHFPGKQAVLAAILLDASEGLLAGGQAVIERDRDAGVALRDLVAFHVDFAVSNAAVIRVQDRDLDSLADPDGRPSACCSAPTSNCGSPCSLGSPPTRSPLRCGRARTPGSG